MIKESAMRIEKIQLLGNTETDQSRLFKTLITSFTEAGFEIVDEKPDVIVTVGGDGTYLYHMQRLNFPELPTIGINAGSLGYFQELELSEIDSFIRDLKAKKYQISRRSLLDVLDENGRVCGTALNEIYVTRDSARTMKAKITIGKGEFARFVGDGLIIHTTQGSTAYAAAAGGPVMAEELPVYGIVPSNAHDTTMYESIRAPLVLPEATPTTITAQDVVARPIRVEVDGRRIDIPIDAPITIKTSDMHLEVLRTQRFDYFERLASKMLHRRTI